MCAPTFEPRQSASGILGVRVNPVWGATVSFFTRAWYATGVMSTRLSEGERQQHAQIHRAYGKVLAVAKIGEAAAKAPGMPLSLTA